MKRTVILISLMLLASFTFAQSIELYSESGKISQGDTIVTSITELGKDVKTYIGVKNTAEIDLDVMVSVQHFGSQENKKLTFCWYNCTAPFGTQDGPLTIAAGDSSDSFYFDYKLNQVDDFWARATFYVKDGNDSSSCYVHFKPAEDLSIAETKNVDFEVYPNPTTKFVNVRLADQAKNKTLTLSNLLGQTIKQKVITNNLEVVDMSSLPQGIYFIQVQEGTKTLYAKKVIKK